MQASVETKTITDEDLMQLSELFRTNKQLYTQSGRTIHQLLKIDDEAAKSRQDVSTGRKSHPFDMQGALDLMDVNAWHSRCIQSKVRATVGLGFETEEDRAQKHAMSQLGAGMQQGSGPTVPGTPPAPAPVASPVTTNNPTKLSRVQETLDPLCQISFLDDTTRVVENWFQVGNGYFEVRRAGPKPTDKILGVYFLQGQTVYKVIENERHDFHFEVDINDGGKMRATRMARFGDKEELLKRMQKTGQADEELADCSEIIHFPQSSSRNRWYGVPDWLAATIAMELSRCVHQDAYDFYNNRGVPEFLLFLHGTQVIKADWDKLIGALKNQIGQGNAHKSIALNIASQNLKIDLHKLGMEDRNGGRYGDMIDSTALEILSVHGIPPLLGGITIPGKLGASNETVQALTLVQLLVIGPSQLLIETILNKTLGNPETNGGLGLKIGDFTLRTILDKINMQQMDTQARMRTEAPVAAAQGRNLNNGLKN